MPANEPTFAGLLGPAASLGRYFSIVGGLTTLIALAVPASLLASGAPHGRPDVAQALTSIKSFGLQEFAVLGVLLLAVGVVLHPLQFPFTQLLEGYWGTSRPASRAMSRSIEGHVQRYSVLAETARVTNDLARQQAIRLKRLSSARESAKSKVHQERIRAVEWEMKAGLASLHAMSGAADNAMRFYPENADQMMPTRLGNVLRRYERLAGAAFGIDAVVAAPYLVQLADDPVRGYVEDARSDLDLAVRMVLVWASTTVLSVLMLWRYDIWLLVPLVTFMFAYISYRGAVFAAVEYGTALQVLTTLTRWNLYDALAVRLPRDSESEYPTNLDLTAVLQGFYRKLPYHHKMEPSGSSLTRKTHWSSRD